MKQSICLGFVEISAYTKNGIRTHDVFRFSDGLTRINKYIHGEKMSHHVKTFEYIDGKKIDILK